MAVNKVMFFDETLIDLTEDTVTESSILINRIAHIADGTIVTGTLFQGFPAEQVITDYLFTDKGEIILDSDEEPLEAQAIYVRK